MVITTLEKNIDKLIARQTTARDFPNFLKAQYQIIKKTGVTFSNSELILVWEDLINKFNEYESKARVHLEGWKGKSGIINLIKAPDKITVIRMQKPNKDSLPKEVKIEISKEQVNAVIIALNRLFYNQPIKTKDIAMIFSKELNLGHADWGRFFSDRYWHNLLTNILDVLDNEGLIHYSGGITTILKGNLNLQEVLC